MPRGIYPRDIPSTPTYTWQQHLPTLIASISTESDAISYLVRNGILKSPTEYACYYCGYVGCRVKGKNNAKGLKCNRGSCGRSLSLLRGTIFSGSKTPLHQILYICTFFLSLAPPSTVISQLHCSSNTASCWYSRLRKWILKHDNASFNGQEVRKEHAFKRPRKKDETEHSAVALWRERHKNNLWDAFLDVLKCREDDILDEDCFKRDRTYNIPVQNVVVPPEIPAMHDFQTDSVLPTINVENEESAIVSGSPMASDTDPAPQIFHEQSVMPRRKRKGRQKPAKENPPKKRLLPESFEIDTKTSSKNNQQIGHQTNQQQQSDGIQSCLAEDPIQVQDGHTQKRLKKKQSIPSFLDLCCLIPSDQKAIEYLASYGIFTLPKDTMCTHCGYKGLRHKEKNRSKSLKCNRCNKGQSIARGTFFEHTKASIRTILHLAAHWLHKISRADTITQLKCSSATVTEFHRNFRKMIKQSMGEDLRVIALTADKNSMSQAIPKGARRNELDEHYCVVLWREVNRENLWEAFLAALRIYTLSDSSMRGGGVSVELNNQVWVDGEKGTACCKYHLKQHLKEMNG